MTDYPRILTRSCKAAELPEIIHPYFLRPPDHDEDFHGSPHQPGWRQWRFVDVAEAPMIVPAATGLRVITVRYLDRASHVFNPNDDVEIAVTDPTTNRPLGG